MTGFTDLHLRAATEVALIAALPWFWANIRGVEQWVPAGPHHALDVLGDLPFAPPAIQGDRSVRHEPVIEPDGTKRRGIMVRAAPLARGEVLGACHVNLRLFDAHPDREAILAACAPFLVHPPEPQVRFA